MTDNLFHEIPEAQAVLRSKGVFRQSKLYRRGDRVYAAWGAGYVRLTGGGGTSVPSISYDTIDDPQDQLDFAVGKTPKWTG